MSARLSTLCAGIAAGMGVPLFVGEQPSGPGNDTTRLDNMPHIDTPKPLSKRRKRRLRGKAKARGEA